MKSESDNQIFYSETIFSVKNGGKGTNFSNAVIECCSGCDGFDKYDVCRGKFSILSSSQSLN